MLHCVAELKNDAKYEWKRVWRCSWRSRVCKEVRCTVRTCNCIAIRFGVLGPRHADQPRPKRAREAGRQRNYQCAFFFLLVLYEMRAFDSLLKSHLKRNLIIIRIARSLVYQFPLHLFTRQPASKASVKKRHAPLPTPPGSQSSGRQPVRTKDFT